jgi:hypothetical protein
MASPVNTAAAAPAAPQNTESEKQKQYASIVPESNDRLQLQHTVSHASNHDMTHVNYVVTGDQDEVYNRFSERRKLVIINVSNALYMLFMGLSPCFYGPYGNIYGRKWVRISSTPPNYLSGR